MEDKPQEERGKERITKDNNRIKDNNKGSRKKNDSDSKNNENA